MRRLKDIFFLGEVNNFKFIIVHRSKEVSAPGGREGSSQSILPHSPSRMEKRSGLPGQRPVWGESPSGDSPDQGSEPLLPSTFISTGSSSITLQHQPG